MVLVAGQAVVGLLLVLALAAAAFGRAPRRATPPVNLRRLLAGVAALYAAGVVALLAHRDLIAGAACALGVLAAALAAWLSRGGRPPDDDAPQGIDWDRFDDVRREWDRPRAPSARR